MNPLQLPVYWLTLLPVGEGQGVANQMHSKGLNLGLMENSHDCFWKTFEPVDDHDQAALTR
jgi:hypothetical protein